MELQQKNEVSLRGVVGNVRLSEVGETAIKRFTLATSRAYKDKEGMVSIETTWFTCVAFESRILTRELLESFEKGSRVEVRGQFRAVKFTRENGFTETHYEVVVTSLSVLPEDVSLVFQTREADAIREACSRLVELTESGYRPFTSPAPSSTEVKLRNCLTSAISLLEQAQALHDSLYKNSL